MFLITSKPTLSTVFNLHSSDWVHCEEETGAHTGISQLTSKLILFFKQIFKFAYFAKKQIEAFQKIL